MKPDLRHQKSLRLKNEDDDHKLFFTNTKLVSKEGLKSSPSLRVLYYGDHVPSAVPFTWETIPGTPKHPSSEYHLSIPPLTPPPSYFAVDHTINSSKKQSKSKTLLSNLVRRITSPADKSMNSSRSDPSSSCVRKRQRLSSCFGYGKRRIRRGYSVLIVRKALLSVVGRG